MSQPQSNDPEEVRKMLIQLHDELERTQTVNENQRALMRHLMKDIQTLLDREDAVRQPSKSILNRWEKSIAELEVSHPTLTTMIEKTLESLNIAGI